MEGAPTSVDLLAILQQVMRHSDLPDELCTVCRLLSTSRTVIDIVCEHCTGRLPVTFSFNRLQQAQQFATWLKTHAKLLRSLDIRLAVARSIAGPKTHAATNLIAEALQHAGEAHPAGLLLQAVKLQELHCSPRLLLQLQYSSQLTKLELQLCQRSRNVRTGLVRRKQQRKRYEMLVPALAGLTSLQHLYLHSNTSLDEQNNVAVLASALSALTKLTTLQMDATYPFKVLQAVPPQLQQLHLFSNSSDECECWGPPIGSLQLERLTSLTLLDTSHEMSYVGSYPRQRVTCLYSQMVVDEDDRLPANLQILTLLDVDSARPFEQLTYLKTLVVTDCSISAANLKLLGNYCRHLQNVQLWYDGPQAGDLNAVAAAWRYVPVTELHIKVSMVSADVLQHIGCLRGCLRHLDISDCGYYATAEQTASALAELTQLHTLQLDFDFKWRILSDASDLTAQQRWESAATSPVVADAIASLPQLTNVCMVFKGGGLFFRSGEPYREHQIETHWYGALLPLCDAVQITALKLNRFRITDRVLQCLVCKLTELRSLTINYDRSLTPECLAWIACLPFLERLDLSKTTITADACHEQQVLGQLQGVQITTGNEWYVGEHNSWDVSPVQDIEG